MTSGSFPVAAAPEEPFEGESPVALRMRAFDWSATPLGAPSGWSASLKTIVRMMLKSRFAMWMAWGPELTFFCNDAYAPTLGVKQSWAIGARSDRVWEEIWPDIGPRIESVFQRNEATWDEDLLLFLERAGYSEETYHTFSYSPLADDDGVVRGMLCVVTEVTERVLAERRVATLRDLGVQTSRARSVREACAIAMEVLGGNRKDFPYALVRLLDPERKEAAFVAGLDLDGDHRLVREPLRIAREPRVALALAAGEPLSMTLTEDETSVLPRGAWARAPTQGVIAPMLAKTDTGISGFLAAGLNPHRQFDAAYRSFIGLVAAQIAAAIANANAHEEERKRAEALAEIDRAKTAFFSNVSHEFRTPLTLMLAPLEDALQESRDERLDMAHRNGLRLLRLVNTLLDFSRAEAGRATAVFEATDLGAFTAELASSFRAAFDKAGLYLDVRIDPIDAPVAVDRSMWEKIVLNLLSNAFKFTLEGGVTVRLSAEDGQIVLRVADTGVGIPEAHLARVFERFHRIENQHGRTHEGTGIGLALVHDLAALHGGGVDVASVEGEGATFSVRIPARWQASGTGTPQRQRAPATARAFVEEALRWLPEGAGDRHASERREESAAPGTRIVLADDNADMRAYIARLLEEAGYEVEAVGDGEAALAAVRRAAPALVLSDVMMPRLDGLGLAGALRADASTASTPVILLSARIGEDAEVEGLGAGADDYITKPFSARELVARIAATITRSSQRAATLERAEAAARQVRLIADAAPLLVAHLDHEGRLLFANRAFQDWFALGAEPGGRPLRACVGEEAHAALAPFIAQALGGERVTAETRLARAGTEPRQVEASFLPDGDSAGRASGVYMFIQDMTERLLKDAALAESEARFREMADTAPVMIWMTDASGAGAYVNRLWRAYTGEDPDGQVQDAGAGIIHPDDLDRVAGVYLNAASARAPFTLEFRLRRADGQYGWCLCAASPRRGKHDEFLGFVGSVIDITERKQAEDRHMLMINELNHRVKNTLAVVQSLALQGLRSAPDNPRQFRDMFVSRLSALSLAHDLLTRSDWSGADLKAIVGNSLSGFAAATRIEADGPSVRLPSRAAVPLSMALHELATNAAKYGALSDERGKVCVEWRISDGPSGKELVFEWVERGGPEVVAPVRRGFGSRLLEHGLRQELDGALSLDFASTGLVCRLRMPLQETELT